MCSVSCCRSHSEMIQAFRTHYPAGRSRWMRCGHKQTDMIDNNTQAGAFKLGSTVTKWGTSTITAPPPPRVDTSMFYVVYTELWPFTYRRINQNSTDQTRYPIPPWANMNAVGSVFQPVGMPPGAVSFTIPADSYSTVISPSARISSFGHDTVKDHQRHAQDSMCIPQKSCAPCDRVIKRLPTGSNGIETKKVALYLIWVWSHDTDSQWGAVLLVQCEVYWVKADVWSRRGVRGREGGEKGSLHRVPVAHFYPPQLSHIHYPSCTFVPLYHVPPLNSLFSQILQLTFN